MLVRLYRTPEGADSAGAEAIPEDTAAPEVQATDSAESKDNQAEKPDPKTSPEQKDAAAPLSDEDLIKRASERSRKNPAYKMTDQEFEAWERLEGRTKAPKKAEKKDAAPTEVKKPEAKDAPVKDQVEEVEADEKPAPLEKHLSKILEKLGAKTLDEAPEKLENLFKLKDDLNGKQGKLDHDRRQMQTNFEKQQAFLEDLMQGKPEAYAYGKAKFGDKWKLPEPQTARVETKKPDSKEFDNFLDPDLARWAKAQVDAVERKYADQFEAIKKETEVYRKRASEDAGREAIIGDLSQLAEKVPDLRPQGASVRQLMKEYFQGHDGDPIDQRLKPLFNVVELMKETRADGSLKYPDLETAYKVWSFDKLPGKIAEAQREGRKQLAGHSPTVGLSDQQGRNSGNFKQYTDADFQLMAQGKMPVPEEWSDKNGTFIPSKLPKKLRELMEESA